MARFIRGIAITLIAVRSGAQSPSTTPPEAQLHGLLPGVAKTTQLAITADAQRVYYGDSTRAIWFYDRTDKRHVRLADAEAWDLTISPTGTALAFSKQSAGSADHHVWVLPLDAKTGLAAGPARRVSATQGDAPSFSADGKMIAFAADDSVGVGQGVMVAPVSGGAARTVVPSLGTAVSNIRWSPDGRSLYFGVNAPVACDPDWSCLPLRAEFVQRTGSVRRVALDGGKPTTIAAKVGNGWPGLSTDGSMLVYMDTGFSRRVVVSDTTGATLQSFALPPRQTVEGWVSASTLLLSDRGDVRRLRSYALADGATRLLVDSLDQFADAAWSPDGQTIKMTRCVAERCELRFVRGDGSLIKVIPLSDRMVGESVWSPDSRRVAYLAGAPNGDRQVNIVEVPSGAIATATTFRANVASLLWTSDSRAVILSTTVGGVAAGRKIVFQRVTVGEPARTLREFVLGPIPSGGAAVTPSSAVILRNGEFRRIALDGDSAETVLIPRTSARNSGWTTVSPDLNRVAQRRTRDSTSSEFNILEIVNTDGSGRVTMDVPFSMLNGPNALRFLPGGAQLVAVAGPSNGEPNAAVYLVTIATKSVKKLFSIPLMSFTGELSIAPDGRSLVYATNETSTPRVFTMDLSRLRGTGRQ